MGVKATLSLVALLALGWAAETRAGAAGSWADWFGGAALLAAGVIALSQRGARWPGALMALAGLDWFASTAFHTISDSRLAFAHRALVIHALLLASTVAAPSRWMRSMRLGVIAIAYVSSLDLQRSLSERWLSASGLAVVVALGIAGLTGQARWRVASLGGISVAVWTVAGGVARTHQWWSADARFQMYSVGFVLSAVSVAIAAWAPSGEEQVIGDADIVRDGGRTDLVIGFRDPSAPDFHDADGRPWSESSDLSVVRVDLGEAYGEAVVGRRTGGLDARQVRSELAEGLRLLAMNRNALRQVRLQASEVSASQDRIRAADERAASEVALELNRHVVGRLDTAVALLADDDEVARGIRNALTDVIDEVHALVDGLAPRALTAGLPSALAALAADQPLPIEMHLDDVGLDSVRLAALYFVAAELLTNASRHAAASSVSLSLRERADHVELAIVDNGTGGAHLRPAGGLAGLERRVLDLGGELRVTSAREGGTAVTVRLPRAAEGAINRP